MNYWNNFSIGPKQINLSKKAILNEYHKICLKQSCHTLKILGDLEFKRKNDNVILNIKKKDIVLKDNEFLSAYISMLISYELSQYYWSIDC